MIETTNIPICLPSKEVARGAGVVEVELFQALLAGATVRTHASPGILIRLDLCDRVQTVVLSGETGLTSPAAGQ